MKKENKGITLVALIITIIILLILAAITINLTIGQRGILRRAEEAGRNYVKAAEEEEKQLANLLGEIDKKENGSDNEGGNEDSNYYGGLDVVPTDTKYFEFVLNEETKTATITNIKEEYASKGYYVGTPYNTVIIDGDKEITEVVLPYSVLVDGQEYMVTKLGGDVLGNSNWGTGDKEIKFTNIILPNTIIEIDDWTFGHCTNLTSITIPKSVTKIGVYAFIGCTKLSSITIPNSVTGIIESAFYDCTNLTVTLEKGSTLVIPDNKWGAKEVIREE